MVIRVSHIDSGIGPAVPVSIVAEILKKRATDCRLHANNLKTLEVHFPPKHGNSKNRQEEDAIRKGARLDHLSDLDVSSNCLHEGYALPHFGGSKNRLSLLEISTRLCSLNLSSNGLTENSFMGLVGSSGRLPRLCTLDISHNNFSKLPPELHATCPSLGHLSATNNRIRSLTALLQSLHKLRGRLESVHFTNGDGASAANNNPVCSKELYREKTVFVLGATLARLDGRRIGAKDRNNARLKLEQGLPNYSGSGAGCFTNTSRSIEQLHPIDHEIEYNPRDQQEAKVLSTERHPSIATDAAAEKIESLEGQVAILSALVKKHVRGGLDDNGRVVPADKYYVESVEKHARKRCDSDTDNGSNLQEESRPTSVDAGNRKSSTDNDNNDSNYQKEAMPAPADPGNWNSSRMRMLEEENEKLCRRQKAAAMSLLLMIVARNGQYRRNTQIAFSFWALSTKLIRHVHESKEKYTESRKHWQKKATELINSAVNEAVERGKRQLDKAQRASKEEIMRVTRGKNDLEKRLETEMKDRVSAEETHKEATAVLKAEIHRLDATSKRHKEHARIAVAKTEGLRKELQCMEESLEREQSERKRLESAINQMSTKNQEAKEMVTAHAVQMQELKLEGIKKDATIQRLKDAYEQAARRSATDRSRCAQALAAEQQSKHLLLKQTNKLHDVEADMERVIANHKSREITIQNDNNTSASKISSLLSEIKDKDRKISTLERRIISISDELDVASKQLVESNRERQQMEVRNNRLLQRQEQLEAEISRITEAETSRNMDLRQSLDRLRESSRQQELDLQTRNKLILQENMMLREDVATHKKRLKHETKSLHKKLQSAQNEWAARQKQLLSGHNIETRKLRDELTAERAIRMSIETKAAALEADAEKQKRQMQNAIEGLSKQLS